MKAVSEIISTLIISGTIIFVSLTIFFYALYNVQSSINSAEFGYIRSVLYSLATNIPNIIPIMVATVAKKNEFIIGRGAILKALIKFSKLNWP